MIPVMMNLLVPPPNMRIVIAPTILRLLWVRSAGDLGRVQHMLEK
jgi:hypothetical protein